MPESNPVTASSGAPVRSAALDLTRAAITLLVIAHHSVLAYHRYAPPAGKFTGDNLIWAAFPVIDPARGPGLDAFTLWNDSFFMAMMFLLAGLFVPPSLARKGAGRFLRDRLLRLGLPFVGAAAVLGPLAYYPAYLLRAEASGHPGFWKAWSALGVWPAGPAWFLWVLLAFSAVAAALHAWAPGVAVASAGWGTWVRERPVRACLVLSAGATLLYLPTFRWVSPYDWFSWGPFTVQTGRILLYFWYFALGCALGAGEGVAEAWMSPAGPLARRWVAWQTAAGVGFVGFVAALVGALVTRGQGMVLAATVLFSVTGALTTFGFLAGFARWGHGGGAVIASLTRNAYGIYLVHYALVTWTQHQLLTLAAPGLVKAALVTAIAIGASWAATILLRRIPGVARVL